MAKVTDKLRIWVWRGNAEGRYVPYDVPVQANQTVLDAVTYIQRRLDATLSYRFACRVGVCGSCAMTVNGRPRWTCRTHIDKVVTDGELRIAPLRNLPVIKDLATDMRPFFEKWRSARGYFHPSQPDAGEFARVPPSTKARRRADAGIECINCGVCYAACDVVRWNGDYLGPAALNRAWTLMNDERDAAHRERLRTVATDGGCLACHSHQSCVEYCPMELNPTASIAGLKRAAARSALKGQL